MQHLRQFGLIYQRKVAMAAMHGCFLIWFQRMVAMIGFGCVMGVSLFCVSSRFVDTVA